MYHISTHAVCIKKHKHFFKEYVFQLRWIKCGDHFLAEKWHILKYRVSQNNRANCSNQIVLEFAWFSIDWSYTHVKISQPVASLQTSRQQVVFARLVTSCQQVWNKLLTTYNNLVDIIRLVTRLFQQGCYNHDIAILLQPCVVNLVTLLLYHDCIRLVRTTL